MLSVWKFCARDSDVIIIIWKFQGYSVNLNEKKKDKTRKKGDSGKMVNRVNLFLFVSLKALFQNVDYVTVHGKSLMRTNIGLDARFRNVVTLSLGHNLGYRSHLKIRQP